ncbi:MAG: hypothetical protein AAF423_04125 [Pseudomonadota bacterium]
MSQENTIFWLKVASGIVIGFGLLGIAGTMPSTAWPTGLFIDLAFWPFDGNTGTNAPETRLMWGINAGVLTGWGVMMWLVATQLYGNEPELARKIILVSVGTWFVLDSSGSVLAGAPMNVVYNLGFLLMFVLPLWRKSPVATA